MTTINTVPNFSQEPPSTSDPDNFDVRADSAFADLHDSIIPGMNTSIEQMNTVAGEVTTTKNEAETAQIAAEDARDKAKEWAEKDAYVEVETDQYSAKHWSVKSEEYKDALLASVNFAGIWEDLSGSLNAPATVYHMSMFWQLTTDIIDITTKEPGIASEWINTNSVVKMNKNSIDSDLVIPEGYNALSVGSILDINADVTINKNATWEII